MGNDKREMKGDETGSFNGLHYCCGHQNP